MKKISSKRRTAIAIFLLMELTITGCDRHPLAGDYYEQKSNGDRMKVVAVGKGRDLVSIFRSNKESIEKLNMRTVGTECVFSGDSVGDANDECVLCERDWTKNGYGSTTFIRFYTMQGVEYFKPNFRLIGDN